MTGVVLTLFMIFFFTTAAMRNYIYTIFMAIHKWFILIYILVVMHGMHQLFAYPVFWPFFLFPATLYIFDRLWSLARINTPLTVTSAQILPSKVLKLTIAKPSHLNYSSGQYIRLSSDFINPGEWHPFSVTSAPNQDYLSVHVRAVGPFTYRLYQLYHPMHLTRRNAIMIEEQGTEKRKPSPTDSPNGTNETATSGSYGAFMNKVRAGFVARSLRYYLPPINVDGPFGGGHTEWSKYRTVILVGAGIGITPFASILQDFMYRVQAERMQEKEKERRHKRKQQSIYPATPFTSNNAAEPQQTKIGTYAEPAGLTKKNMNGQRLPVDSTGASLVPSRTRSTRDVQSSNSSSSSASPPPLLLYFIWIGRSHTGYEWLIDMIREAESLDHSTGRLHLQVQLYITTPPSQFDLRTAVSVRNNF